MKKPLILAVLCGAFLLTANSPAVTVLGGLVGGDLTDPENDGTGDGLNYNATFNANDEPGFGGGEFAFNVFNNLVGGGNSKWCCGQPGGPEWVSATFAQPVVLTSFTLTSGNDSPNRDPADFEIQGTNGDPFSGTYVSIYTHTGVVGEWTARNQTLRFDGGGVDFADPAAYTTLRMITTGTSGGITTGAWFQLNEIEYFGNVVPEPSALAFFGLAGLGLILRRRR